MLFADVGSISVWRRPLTPEDIKLLSRTFKDVKLALPEITRQQLVSTGLALPLLTMDVGAVDGLGMCTYNAHIKWNMPKLPLDYKKLGYNIIRYEAKIEYYIATNSIGAPSLGVAGTPLFYHELPILSIQVPQLSLLPPKQNPVVSLQ